MTEPIHNNTTHDATEHSTAVAMAIAGVSYVQTAQL